MISFFGPATPFRWFVLSSKNPTVCFCLNLKTSLSFSPTHWLALFSGFLTKRDYPDIPFLFTNAVGQLLFMDLKLILLTIALNLVVAEFNLKLATTFKLLLLIFSSRLLSINKLQL